ncbi:putative endonuclease V [Trypanosoma cruzi]|nr:putative endonuclease V [Trypanosoma cruzi]
MDESKLVPADLAKKREMWEDVQRQLAGLVCVPHILESLEQCTEEDMKEVIFFTPTFALPQGLLDEFYASAVLGPQLRREAESRKLALPSSLSPLRYVGGVDVSFLKGTNLAVACLVVMEYPNMRRCRTVYHQCEVTEPYIPGFLAFREVVPLVELMNKLRDGNCAEDMSVYPQLLLVDGCGVQHPLRCGLASHLGVVLDIPTVGCAKNFMAVDGMTRKSMQRLFEANDEDGGGAKTRTMAPFVKSMVGQSGALWGYAATPNAGVKKPIFISPGHRVGYAEAAALVLSMCKHRVPEPIRAADFSSREYIRRMTRK